MLTTYVDPHTDLLRDSGVIPLDRHFTRSEVGLPRKHLQALADDGYVRPVVHGVWVASALGDTLGLRARALSLVVSPEAVVVDRTAAWLHGVDTLLPGEHLTVPEVCVFDRKRGGRLRRPDVASGQRTLEKTDVRQVDGVLVTTPLRTACDLAMQRNRDRAFASLEAMLHAGVDRDLVEGQLKRFKGRRHVRAFRGFLPFADSRSDSIAESVTRLRWLDTTTPFPEPQRPVIGPLGQAWSLDMGLDDLWFAVEYDGREFHDGEDNEEHDEKRRGWITRNTPWLVKVVRQPNIFGPQRDFEDLLPDWLAEARRTLPERLRRGGRWYDDIGE